MNKKRLAFIRELREEYPNYLSPTISIGNYCFIHDSAVIGNDSMAYERNERGELEKFPQIGGVIIGNSVSIGANSCIDRGATTDTVIGDGTKIANLVQIAHGVVIGQHCLIGGHAQICGSATIGDRVYIAPGSVIMNKITIGNDAFIGLGAVVTKDVPAGETWAGNPAKPIIKLKDKE